MADEGLYVPVAQQNYVPKGAPDVLEGFVPDHPADDKELNIMRNKLYEQGLEDAGPDKPAVFKPVPNSEPDPADIMPPAPEEPLVEEKDFTVTPPEAPKSSSDPVH